MSHPGVQRLVVELPAVWNVADAAAVSTVVADDLPGDMRELARFVASDEGPILIANVATPVRDGDAEGVLIANLTAWSYTSASLPKPPSELASASILQGVKVTRGKYADFYERVFPVTSADGEITVLLIFTSPNLPLRDELDAAFESIAHRARIENNAGDHTKGEL